MTDTMKINRPAEDGETMTKVLLDGEGHDPAAMRRPPAAPAGEEDEETRREREARQRRPREWWDDGGIYGEGS